MLPAHFIIRADTAFSVAFTAFSGLLLNYVTVSAKLALATLQQDEYERLRAQEAVFKTGTAVIIWTGTIVIIVQMVYYAFKFCRKHGAQVRRFGGSAPNLVSRLASRVSSRVSSQIRKPNPSECADTEPANSSIRVASAYTFRRSTIN